MATKIIETNIVSLSGVAVTPFKLSHELFGEHFYITYICSERTSGAADIIPVMVSDRATDVSADIVGKWIEIEGSYRSYNYTSEGSKHVILTVFANELFRLESGTFENKNEIYLDGFVCKKPVYRTTPLGREITDIIVAVNRSYNRCDYIPCIAWGRNARFAEKLEIGSQVKIEGRIQSREYEKCIEGSEEPEIRTVYEVSANKIERVC